jgi:hypothetical protein
MLFDYDDRRPDPFTRGGCCQEFHRRNNIRMSKRKSRPVAPPMASEPPAVETLTVGWMLSVMTALVCELGFIAARGYLLAFDGAARRIQILALMLMFAALVVGTVSVGLMVVVLRTRRIAPPQGIVVFSSVVGLAPAITILLRLLAGGWTPFAP